MMYTNNNTKLKRLKQPHRYIPVNGTDTDSTDNSTESDTNIISPNREQIKTIIISIIIVIIILLIAKYY